MRTSVHLKSRLQRLTSGAYKLRWGVRTVGILASVRGSIALVKLKVTRPSVSTVHLRSGPTLAFDYPGQLVPALVVFGDFIDPEFPFLRKLGKPDWVVLDVGAAIGQFTVFSALIPAAVVHAFEPSGENIETLRRNLHLNSVAERVSVHQLALSDKNGEAIFATAHNAYLSRLDRSGEQAGGEKIPVRTLSDLLPELGIEHAAVLKVNVSGFEPEVLRGAEGFLANGGADILILLIGRDSIPSYQGLAGLGYRFFFYHPVKNELHELHRFDSSSITAPPWPARHLIGVRKTAIEEGLLQDFRIVDPLGT